MPRTTNPLSSDQRQAALAARQAGQSFRTITDSFGGVFTYEQVYEAAWSEARRNGIDLPSLGRGRRPRTSTSTHDAFGRRFGIEIEFTGIDNETAAIAMRSAGLACHAEGYNHSTRNHWKIVVDGTIGWEAVSPILQGEDGYQQVRTAMKALRDAGARVNRHAGMHVHHDMGGLTGEAIARFVQAYVTNQAHIDRLVSPSRRSESPFNDYCGPVQEWELQLITGELDAYRRVPTSVSRFKTINVQSFPRQGTVEVRQHQGCLIGDRAVAWIKFVQALIEASAVQDLDLASDDLAALVNSLAPAGLRPATRRYLLARAERLNQAVESSITNNTGV